MDIITFARDTLHQTLTPIQALALKVAYGIPLDATNLISWRVPDSGCEIEVTESQYLKFLFLTGRSNVWRVTQGQEYLEVAIVAGRRSGKSYLGEIMGAYETYRLLHDPSRLQQVACGASAVWVSVVGARQDMTNALRDAFRDLVQNSFHIAPHTTQSSLRYLEPQSQTLSRVGTKFRSAQSLQFRGACCPFTFLDEGAFMTGFPELVGLATKVPGWKVAVLTSTSPRDKEWQSWWFGGYNKPGCLRLQIPTWDLQPGWMAPDAIHGRTIQEEYGCEIL